MPRPAKKKVDLNQDALRDMLQQIWNEADEQRNKGIFQYNKWNRDVKDNTDIALVGKTNNELLKVIDSSIDKKIQVARLVNDFIKQGSSSDVASSIGGSSDTVSEDAKDAIFEMIQKASAANNTEYVKKETPEAEKDPF